MLERSQVQVMSKYTSIVPEKHVCFAEPTQSLMGGQFVAIKDDKGQELSLQTPQWESKGIHMGLGPNTNDKHYLTLQCDPLFVEWHEALEKHVLDTAIQNSSQWFGSEHSPSLVETWFRPGLSNTHTWTLHVPARSVIFFDKAQHVLEFDQVPKGSCNLAAHVALEGVWFRDHKFGLRWTLRQAKIYKDNEAFSFSNVY